MSKGALIGAAIVIVICIIIGVFFINIETKYKEDIFDVIGYLVIFGGIGCTLWYLGALKQASDAGEADGNSARMVYNSVRKAVLINKRIEANHVVCDFKCYMNDGSEGVVSAISGTATYNALINKS